MTGLRASQAGLSIVASNVANAETPGYVRKTPVQVTNAAGDLGVGVRIAAINRELDQFVQRQLRVESSGAAYADLRAQFYERLQNVYGVPGSQNALESVFNGFLSAVQALATTPDSAAGRSAVLSSARLLSQRLNSMTLDVQALRTDAELALADAVAGANDAMQRIAQINRQLATSTTADGAAAALLDQRDSYIDRLAQLMDIQVIATDRSQIGIFTNSGVQLVGTTAATLEFDAQGSMTAASRWSADPASRSVGTIILRGANGGDVDLIAGQSIRSGQMATLIEMRDQVLVQAQRQLDEFAAGLARSLADHTVAGTQVNVGAHAGFDIDLAGLLAGNAVRLAYTDTTTGAQHAVTLVRVDDPGALPLSDTATMEPGDRVIGLDFAGGLTGIVNQITKALGTTSLQFSNPAGTTLRILDDGGLGRWDVNAVSATKTMTALAGGAAELPFFLDGNGPFSGAIMSAGGQAVGFAGRIAVNPGLLADASRLVVYQIAPATPAGDQTRPNLIYDRLSNAALNFSPQSGIGSTSAPFSGTLGVYLRQVISQQGEAAEAAMSLKQGQEVVFNALRERFSDAAGVNIDQEMANLLNLQNAYAANARVLSTVREMLEILANM
jgi:flagellar hook-associated protein 1 FlgK